MSQAAANQIKALSLPGPAAARTAGDTNGSTTFSGLPGVSMTASYVRTYPDGTATSNLLGITSTTASGGLKGAAGLELSDNALLAGQSGPGAVPGVDQRGADPAGRGQEHARGQRRC